MTREDNTKNEKTQSDKKTNLYSGLIKKKENSADVFKDGPQGYRIYRSVGVRQVHAAEMS